MLNNTTLGKLEDWGIDLQGTMTRMLGDVGFYETCLEKLYSDENFTQMGERLKNGNTKGAFANAHTLKGITATLGIMPLYKPLNQIVEQLRKEDLSETPALYDLIMQRHEELGKLLDERDGK